MPEETPEILDRHLGQILKHSISMLRATGWTREEVLNSLKGVVDFVFGAEEEEENQTEMKEQEEEAEEDVKEEENAENKNQSNKKKEGGEGTEGVDDDFGFGHLTVDGNVPENAHETGTRVYSADDEDSESTVVWTVPGDPRSVIRYIVDKPRRGPY